MSTNMLIKNYSSSQLLIKKTIKNNKKSLLNSKNFLLVAATGCLVVQTDIAPQYVKAVEIKNDINSLSSLMGQRDLKFQRQSNQQNLLAQTSQKSQIEEFINQLSQSYITEQQNTEEDQTKLSQAQQDEQTASIMNSLTPEEQQAMAQMTPEQQAQMQAEAEQAAQAQAQQPAENFQQQQPAQEEQQPIKQAKPIKKQIKKQSVKQPVKNKKQTKTKPAKVVTKQVLKKAVQKVQEVVQDNQIQAESQVITVQNFAQAAQLSEVAQESVANQDQINPQQIDNSQVIQQGQVGQDQSQEQQVPQDNQVMSQAQDIPQNIDTQALGQEAPVQTQEQVLTQNDQNTIDQNQQQNEDNKELIKKLDLHGMIQKFQAQKQTKLPPKKQLSKQINKKVIQKPKKPLTKKAIQTVKQTQKKTTHSAPKIVTQQQIPQEDLSNSDTQDLLNQAEQDLNKVHNVASKPDHADQLKKFKSAVNNVKKKNLVKAKPTAAKKALTKKIAVSKPAAHSPAKSVKKQAPKTSVKKPALPIAKKPVAKKQAPKPVAKEQPVVQQQEQFSVDNLVLNFAKGQEFQIPINVDDNQLYAQDNAPVNKQFFEFSVIPKDPVNGVASPIQVLSSERIIGYNTYNGILDKSKQMNQVDEGDYYNVTLNLVVRKGSNFQQNFPQQQVAVQEQSQPQQQTQPKVQATPKKVDQTNTLQLDQLNAEQIQNLTPEEAIALQQQLDQAQQQENGGAPQQQSVLQLQNNLNMQAQSEIIGAQAQNVKSKSKKIQADFFDEKTSVGIERKVDKSEEQAPQEMGQLVEDTWENKLGRQHDDQHKQWLKKLHRRHYAAGKFEDEQKVQKLAQEKADEKDQQDQKDGYDDEINPSQITFQGQKTNGQQALSQQTDVNEEQEGSLGSPVNEGAIAEVENSSFNDKQPEPVIKQGEAEIAQQDYYKKTNDFEFIPEEERQKPRIEHELKSAPKQLDLSVGAIDNLSFNQKQQEPAVKHDETEIKYDLDAFKDYDLYRNEDDQDQDQGVDIEKGQEQQVDEFGQQLLPQKLQNAKVIPSFDEDIVEDSMSNDEETNNEQSSQILSVKPKQVEKQIDFGTYREPVQKEQEISEELDEIKEDLLKKDDQLHEKQLLLQQNIKQELSDLRKIIDERAELKKLQKSQHSKKNNDIISLQTKQESVKDDNDQFVTKKIKPSKVLTKKAIKKSENSKDKKSQQNVKQEVSDPKTSIKSDKIKKEQQKQTEVLEQKIPITKSINSLKQKAQELAEQFEIESAKKQQQRAAKLRELQSLAQKPSENIPKSLPKVAEQPKQVILPTTSQVNNSSSQILAAPVDLHKDYKKNVPLKSPKKTQTVPKKHSPSTKQSGSQSDIQLKNIKNKLALTSKEVQKAVASFQKVHSDLQDMKEQFIAKKLVQLEASTSSRKTDKSNLMVDADIDQSVDKLKDQLKSKKAEMEHMMAHFDQIDHNLQQLQIQSNDSAHQVQFSQLMKLRTTLSKTLEESRKLGQVDLKEMEETENIDKSLSDSSPDGFIQLQDMMSIIGDQLSQIRHPDDNLNIQLSSDSLDEDSQNFSSLKEKIDQFRKNNHQLQRHLQSIL